MPAAHCGKIAGAKKIDDALDTAAETNERPKVAFKFCNTA
jgi:hypothetical protein